MNRDGAASKSMEPLWTRSLQVPSHNGQDARETGIVSPIHSLDNTRLKRGREDSEESEQQEQAQHYKSVHAAPASSYDSDQQKPVFKLQPLSLDRGAIAPGLATPAAPFAKSERKKAYVSAIYYSECFLRNVEPKVADLAAFNIQNQYNKWWVQSKKPKSSSRDPNSAASSTTKRRRLDCQSEAVIEAPAPSLPTSWDPEVITLLKENIVDKLQKTGGDTSTTEFQRCLEQLQAAYAAKHDKATMIPMNGTWLTLTKPSFAECQGQNAQGEHLYTLGRMSFDMFRPTHLKCSIRAVMNNIRPMDLDTIPKSFPKRLAKHLKDHHHDLDNPIRHYDIVVAFTIQPNQTRDGTEPSGKDQEYVIPRPIRGLMTNYGYMVDDPETPDRNSIWFSGGSIEVQDEIEDAEVWTHIFDESLAPDRDSHATANVVAAKLLLGAHTTTSRANSHSNEGTHVDDGVPSMSYHFKRPIGGHGEVYCDVLYYDETLRITRGHRGSIFVSTRVPDF